MSPSHLSRGVASSPSGLGAAPRRRLRRWALLASSVAASVWLWQWVSTDDQGQPVTEQSDEPSLQIENLRSFLVRRGGKPLWEISARRVEVSADRRSTNATGVQKGTFYRDGKPFLQMAAGRVALSNTTNDLEATGGVKATGPNGFKFETAKANWNSRAQVVECPQPVTAHLRGLVVETEQLRYQWDRGILTSPAQVEIRAPGAVFRGKNLHATLNDRKVRLSGGVQLRFNPKVARLPERH